MLQGISQWLKNQRCLMLPYSRLFGGINDQQFVNYRLGGEIWLGEAGDFAYIVGSKLKARGWEQEAFVRRLLWRNTQ